MTEDPRDEWLAQAVRAAEARRRAALKTPTADEMLVTVRQHATTPRPRPVAPSLSGALLLAWRIMLAQTHVVHRAVLPVTSMLVIAGSLAIAASGAPAVAAGNLHAAFIVACVAVVCVLASPGDVRREFLAVTPVSPAVVLAARMTLLLGVTLFVAALTSAVLTQTGTITAEPVAEITRWLGPALLTAGLVTWAGVWRGQTVAAIIGILTLLVITPTALGQHATVLAAPVSALTGATLLAAAAWLASREPIGQKKTSFPA